jgi:uncharacterized protein YjbI with pentapeptide repeats
MTDPRLGVVRTTPVGPVAAATAAYRVSGKLLLRVAVKLALVAGDDLTPSAIHGGDLTEGELERAATGSASVAGLAGAARLHTLAGITEIALRVAVLEADADERRHVVILAGAIEIDDDQPLEALRVEAGASLGGAPIPWPEVEGGDELLDEDEAATIVRVASPPPRRAEATAAMRIDQLLAPALPFQRPPAAPPPVVVPAPPAPPEAAPSAPAPPEPALPAAPSGRASPAIPFVNRTPLAAFTIPWEREPGRPVRAVVVKGSFDLVPGAPAAIRAEAEPPSGDRHLADDLTRSLVYPSDFVVMKPKVDVTLKGHAVAPFGSAPAGRVRFCFGREGRGFDRTLAVFGDRSWEGGVLKLAPSAPRPFEAIPLVWERAFGGPGCAENPVGLGHEGHTRPPNLEDPARLLTGPGDAPPPAGFGAVPPSWRARAAKLGTFDAAWARSRWPYFPADLDPSCLQAAPPAQQLASVRGDEPFELVGMDRQHPVLDGKLPGLLARCFAQRSATAGGAFEEIALRLDTVSFDVDAMRIHLVFRGLFDVADDDASDVEELFVVAEDLAAPRRPLAAVRASYRAAKLSLEPLAEDPDAPPPANDPALPRALSAHERRIEERLRAAGVGALGEVAPLPPPPPRERPPRALDPLRRQVVALLARGESLAGLELAFADLSELDFAGHSLAGAVLQGALLRGARLTGCDLTGAQLGGAVLEGANLAGTQLALADLTQADLTSAILDGASLDDAVLERVRGDGASLREAKGARARLGGGSWRSARFDAAELTGLDLIGADLEAATLDGASLPEVKLYDARGSHISARDAKMPGARADGAILPGIALRGAKLAGSIWDGACLDEASFLGASLAGASFCRASCARALFSGADLTGARLVRAQLGGASFLRANLMAASLEGADLGGADLRGANLHAAETWKAKLDGANLELAIVTQSKLAEGRPG